MPIEKIILAVIAHTIFATIAGFWATAMKRRWWVWVLVSLFLTPFIAYIGLIIVFFTSGQPRRIARAVKQGTQSSYGAVTEHFSGESPMDERDRGFYTKAGSEVASKNYDQALFTKAFSESDGDENKAKALYIRYRFNEMRQHRKKAEEAAEKQQKEDEDETRHAMFKANATKLFILLIVVLGFLSWCFIFTLVFTSK